MRIFSDLIEATDEAEREVLEMGLDLDTYSYQDKIVAGNEEFKTKELMGYGFRVQDIGLGSRRALIQKHYLSYNWIKDEFAERISNLGTNPGSAYLHRADVWSEFLTNGKFHYTYSERINDQMELVINELRIHPNSRQAIIQMYRNDIDKNNWGGKGRIPCSMHYQFLIRQDKVHVIYTMRSSDLYAHFLYDIILASMKANHIAESLKKNLGSGIFNFGSLHGFYRDLKAKGVF